MNMISKKGCFVFVLAISFFLMNLYAQDFAGGSGTANDPWQIESAIHLDNIRNYLGVEHNDKYYIQIADIDLGVPPWSEGEGWEPIGWWIHWTDYEPFMGTYLGNGFTIEDLFINSTEDSAQGLFGCTEEALLQSVNLVNLNITGEASIGGLVGRSSYSEIDECYVSGNIAGGDHVGGVLGQGLSTIISNSHSAVNVTGTNLHAGGIVGACYDGTIIHNCISTGTVAGFRIVGGLVGSQHYLAEITESRNTGDVSGSFMTGGLVGYQEAAEITSSHSTGNVAGQNQVGGLVGLSKNSQIMNSSSTGSVNGNISVGGFWGEINNSEIANSFSLSEVSGIEHVGGFGGTMINGLHNDCYSAGNVTGYDNVGGFVGFLSYYYSDSYGLHNYWDIETSGQTESSFGSGRTTADMTFPYSGDTFVNWNFGLWAADYDYDINGGYPYHAVTDPVLDIPYALIDIAPENGSSSVSPAIVLSWIVEYDEFYTNSPSGFRISVGTDNPPTNIAHNQDLGWVHTYSFSQYLEQEVTFYWQVIPYNNHGDAEDCPVWSFTTTTFFAGGDGSEDNPWQIANSSQLNNVRYFLGEDNNDCNFVMTTDIDLYDETRDGGVFWNFGEGWTPISRDPSNLFQGTFNGNGHIVNGIYINRPQITYQSLFGVIWCASITGVGLTNVDITGSYFTSGLVGHAYLSTITNSFSTGIVNGTADTGGLVGVADMSTLGNCYSDGTVNGTNGTGGLIGSATMSFESTISNCYSRSDVNGNEATGGLIGSVWVSSGNLVVSNCYSTGQVTGETSTGGLVGSEHGASSINSYWDLETSGQTSSSLGEGRTTAEMTYPYANTTYLDWDFADIWGADETSSVNDGYPYLLENIHVSVEQGEIASPSKISMSNFPNPFNPNTTIVFNLSQPEKVKLIIYNIKGQIARNLCDEYLDAGEHRLTWNGKDDKGVEAASGIYLYQLITRESILTKKMMMIK
jgi:hypothetical protein